MMELPSRDREGAVFLIANNPSGRAGDKRQLGLGRLSIQQCF